MMKNEHSKASCQNNDNEIERFIERGRREFYKEWFEYIFEYDEDSRFFYDISSELFEET